MCSKQLLYNLNNVLVSTKKKQCLLSSISKRCCLMSIVDFFNHLVIENFSFNFLSSRSSMLYTCYAMQILRWYKPKELGTSEKGCDRVLFTPPPLWLLRQCKGRYEHKLVSGDHEPWKNKYPIIIIDWSIGTQERFIR